MKLNVLIYTQRRLYWWFASDWNKTLSVNQLWFSLPNPKAQGSISVRMFTSSLPQRTSICVYVEMSDSLHTDRTLIALNFCYDSWRMSVCLTSASLSQVSSWSLFYPKLLHSQQALHLNTEGVCKDPASQHFSFPFSYILCSWLAFRVSSLLFMNGFNWGFLQLWALLDS